MHIKHPCRCTLISPAAIYLPVLNTSVGYVNHLPPLRDHKQFLSLINQHKALLRRAVSLTPLPSLATCKI